jgi:hypothetical protein
LQPSLSGDVSPPCRDLVAKEAAEAEKRKEERRRKERKNRDAFTALLRAHLADGRLSCKTRFKVRLRPSDSRFLLVPQLERPQMILLDDRSNYRGWATCSIRTSITPDSRPGQATCADVRTYFTMRQDQGRIPAGSQANRQLR